MDSIWGLPTTVSVAGEDCSVCTDFRDILEIIDILQEPERDDVSKIFVALSLFYDDVPADLQAAADAMMVFINQGHPDDGARQPKSIDWKQDAGIIVAEVNKVAGKEIRALEYLHWWTFLAYFFGIGEGQLSFIVGIREKLRKGKQLEPYEREFYSRNRSVVDFKQTLTTAEEDELNKWLGK